MNKEGNIDLERISTSIERLSSIENLVNLVTIADNFEELEDYFRQINFEHSSCLSYKEQMAEIFSDWDQIKRKVNELVDALRRTKANYININHFSDEEIKQFSQIYKSTNASEDLSKLVGTSDRFNFRSAIATDLTNSGAETIPSQNGISTVPAPVTNPEPVKEPINTVPIGIAIGATGIAGSVGAVIADDIYRRREKEHKKDKNEGVYFEEYDEDDILDEKYNYDEERKAPAIQQGPYHATRMAREADRFYGNQLDKLNLEDEEEEDDNDYDEF